MMLNIFNHQNLTDFEKDQVIAESGKWVPEKSLKKPAAPVRKLS